MAYELAFTKGSWLHPDKNAPDLQSCSMGCYTKVGRIEESMLLTVHVVWQV